MQPALVTMHFALASMRLAFVRVHLALASMRLAFVRVHLALIRMPLALVRVRIALASMRLAFVRVHLAFVGVRLAVVRVCLEVVRVRPVPVPVAVLAVLLLLAAACGARRAPAHAQLDDDAPYRVSADNERKLSPYVVRQWRDLGLPRGEYTPIIVTVTGDTAVATEALASFGAAFVRPVVTSPGAAGTLHARATERSDQLLAMLPNDALRFVVAQPWVVRLDGANSWPSGPELPADVERRLDPELRSALHEVGRARPYAVGGIAETRGCLDDAQRAKLVELGAIVGSVIAHPSCTHTILTFEIPLSRLVALASLPWIVQLEGSRPMYPEDVGEPDHE